MFTDKKKKLTKSQLISSLQKESFSDVLVFDVINNKDKTDLLKEIDSSVKRSSISVIIVQHK